VGRSALLATKWVPPVVRKEGVTVHMVETAGSVDGLNKVNDNTIQFAFVEGGLGAEKWPNVREVAPLHTTMLHLVLRHSLYDEVVRTGNLREALRGKRISNSTPGSGTFVFSTNVLRKIGLNEGEYTPVPSSNSALLDEAKTEDDIPDALFIISLLPSPVVERLVDDFDYRVYPLPYADAFGLQDPFIYKAIIPPYTYSLSPAVPAQPIETISRRVLLLANKDVPDDEVVAMLKATLDGGYARVYDPHLDAKQLDLEPEYPWHPGTEAYLAEKTPVTQEQIAGLSKLGPALGALLPGLLLLRRSVRRWRMRRQVHSLRDYLVEVNLIERSVRSLEEAPSLNLGEVLRNRRRLSELKSNALEDYTKGLLLHEDLMGSFLSQVTDLRNYVNALLASNRDVLGQTIQDPSLLDELEDLVRGLDRNGASAKVANGTAVREPALG
jgi:TRAP-type uncharacterized transport system substrate-binding protein